MNIIRYIGKRLLFIVPQLIGIVLVCFILVKAIPGDPATLMLGPMASDESISRLRRELGLDRPLPVQFLHREPGTGGHGQVVADDQARVR